MKEVKSPKKPLIFYYGIALLVIVLFNVIVSPLLIKARVVEVDYGTFMSMIEQKKIGNVEVKNDQIIFTEKDNEKVIYKTGAMNDPTLTQRLYDSGAKFSKDIETTTSPIVSFLLTFVLPLLIFIGLGQYMAKKLMEQAGGKDSLAFGFGKSNAKVYVPSTQGIHFSDVAGEDEAKESLAEIVDYLHNPKKYSDVARPCPRAYCSSALPERVKPCSQRLLRAKLTCRFSRCPARNLSRCSSAWALQRSGIFSARQKKKLPA